MNSIKSSTAKLAAGIVGVAMFASAFMPSLAAADTASDLQAQINSLLATIQSLQAQLSATTGGSTGYTFNTNLTMGSTGVDVMNLQKVLNMSADTRVAASGVGSSGNETSYFGGLTRAAVVKFQVKNGITPAVGYVGPITRAKLNSMNTGGVVVTPPVGCTTNCTTVGGSLVVAAGSQPANSLLPQGAARIPFTTFTLRNTGSNAVTVTGITVQKAGLGDKAIFSGIVLVDSNNVQIGTSRTLNSNDQATIGENFTVNSGETKTLTVAGNAAASLTSYNGQTISLSVVSVNTSATVSGSLPITGASHTANNTLSIGSVSTSTSAFDPGAAQTKNIGDTNVRISGVKFTAGSVEDLRLFSVRWRQVGTGSSVDISNVVTVVNGTSYPTTVSADGKYYTSVFPGGLLIPKGQSADVYNQADLTGTNSASRTIDFDIDRVTDVYFVGQTYGYGVAPSGTYTPWFTGYVTTINAGTVTTISKANEVPAQNIASNVSGQPLGGFATNFAGEPVSVTAMTFTVSTSTATIGTNSSVITNVSIVDSNGVAVAGPVDATVSGSGLTQTISFTDTVTFPVGRKVYTLEGKIPASAVNGAVLSVATTPSGWSNPTGDVSNSAVTISTGAITMNSMTVKGAALAVNISANPASQNVVGGITNFVLANFQLDGTQSGEDVRISSFPVYMTATGAAGDLTGCTLYNGATPLNTGTNVVNTWSSTVKKNYTFDNSLIVAKGTLVTLSLQCNVASSPTAGSFQVTAASAGDFSVTGLTSSNTVTPTIGSGDGGTMTVGTGSFTVSVDSSSPATTTVAGGTSGVTLGVIKLRATNESVTLTKLGLKLTLGTASHVSGASIYNSSGALVGTVSFPQGSLAVATSTLSSPVSLAVNTDVRLTIKADVNAIGVGQSGNPGQPVIINAVSAEGSGQSSGTTLIVGNITPGTAGVRTQHSFPTVVSDTLAATGLADGNLMRFKVTANSAGDVSLYQLAFNLATSGFATGGGVTNLKLNVYTDSSYSSLVQTNIGAATGQFGGTNGTSTVGLINAPLVEFQTTTNALPIPAGATRYFNLTGTVSSLGTSGTSVTTTLLGDAAYVASAHFNASTDFVSSTTGAYADTNNNFIWSGNSTTTPAISNDTDWVNGFSILGLPSGGLSFTRNQ